MKLMDWIYITATRAKELGFTHHGKYYFLPIWISDDPNAPLVGCKSPLFDWLMDIMTFMEVQAFTLVHPDEEPEFKFMLGKEIA